MVVGSGSRVDGRISGQEIVLAGTESEETSCFTLTFFV